MAPQPSMMGGHRSTGRDGGSVPVGADQLNRIARRERARERQVELVVERALRRAVRFQACVSGLLPEHELFP